MECVFCRIIEGKIKSDIVYEDNNVFAFRDINPQAPVHILIVPKKHIPSLEEIKEEDVQLIGQIHNVARSIAQKEGISKSGYRLVLNTGPDSGQAVYHIHFHLIGGRKLLWPPG